MRYGINKRDFEIAVDVVERNHGTDQALEFALLLTPQPSLPESVADFRYGLWALAMEDLERWSEMA